MARKTRFRLTPDHLVLATWPVGATTPNPVRETMQKRTSVAKVTSLASGQITGADQLTIELVQAAETPATILIRWPGAPSVSDPRKFASVAAAVLETLAQARASLAKANAREL